MNLFDSDGTWLACASGNTISLFTSKATNKNEHGGSENPKVITFANDSSLVGCQFNRNAKVLVATTKQGEVHLYAEGGLLGTLPPQVSQQYSGACNCSCLAPSTERMLVGCNNKVLVWGIKLSPPALEGTISDYSSDVCAMAANRDILISACADGSLWMHNMAGAPPWPGKQLQPASPLTHSLIAFNKHQPHVIATGTKQGTVHVWALSPQGVTQHLQYAAKHSGPVTGITFLPSDQHTIMTCSVDSELRIYDTRRGENGLVQSFKLRHAFTCMQVNEDGTKLALGTSDGAIRVMDMRQLGKEVSVVRSKPGGQAVTAVAWQCTKQHKRSSSSNINTGRPSLQGGATAATPSGAAAAANVSGAEHANQGSWDTDITEEQQHRQPNRQPITSQPEALPSAAAAAAHVQRTQQAGSEQGGHLQATPRIAATTNAATAGVPKLNFENLSLHTNQQQQQHQEQAAQHAGHASATSRESESQPADARSKAAFLTQRARGLATPHTTVTGQPTTQQPSSPTHTSNPALSSMAPDLHASTGLGSKVYLTESVFKACLDDAMKRQEDNMNRVHDNVVSALQQQQVEMGFVLNTIFEQLSQLQRENKQLKEVLYRLRAEPPF